MVAMTAPVRGSRIIRAANTSEAMTRMVCGRPVRSASHPPNGTENTAIHNPMLSADPAEAIDQPRSTSIDGPKLKITAKPTLNRPQIRPASDTARAALRSKFHCRRCGSRSIGGGR